MSSFVPRLNATRDYAKLNLLFRRECRGNLKVDEMQLMEKDVDLAR